MGFGLVDCHGELQKLWVYMFCRRVVGCLVSFGPKEQLSGPETVGTDQVYSRICWRYFLTDQRLPGWPAVLLEGQNIMTLYS